MDSSDSQGPPPNLYDPFQFLGQRGNYKGTLFVSVSTLTIYIYIYKQQSISHEELRQRHVRDIAP